MNGGNVLLDTNIVIYYLKGDSVLADMLIEENLYISFITEIELLSYNKGTQDSSILLKNFINQHCTVLPFDQRVKEVTIEVRKSHKLKLPDAFIAAASIVSNIPLVTADGDFLVVQEAQVWHYDTKK